MIADPAGLTPAWEQGGDSVQGLFDTIEGMRHQVMATDSLNRRRIDPVPGSARHRVHARVEDRIRCGKDTGFGRFPSRLFAINQAWLELAPIGIDLLAWTSTCCSTVNWPPPSPRNCATGSCTSRSVPGRR